MPNADADLRIESIEIADGELATGKEVRFRVVVRNIGPVESSSYRVVTYDENDNELDTDRENPVGAGKTDNAYAYITMNEAGSYTLKFVIEGGESDNSVVYKSFSWSGKVEPDIDIKGFRNGNYKKYSAKIGDDDDDNYGIGIRFDFDDLPQNSVIQKAVLKLDPNARSMGTRKKHFKVARFTSSKGWYDATSRYYDDAAPLGGGYIDDLHEGLDIDITYLVSKWKKGDFKNYGMYIFADDNKSGYYDFDEKNNIEIELDISLETLLPEGATEAAVKKVLAVPIARFQQEAFSFYLTPVEARGFARKLRISSAGSVVDWLMAKFVGFLTDPYSIVRLIDAINKNETADKIGIMSEDGPVKITMFITNVNEITTPLYCVEKWNGKTIDLSLYNDDNATEILESVKYTYPK